MSPDDLMTEAQAAVRMALDAGADDAVVSISQGTSTDFNFRDGAMESVQESAGSSLTVRLYVDGRYSAHSTNDFRPEPLRHFVSEAVALTRHLQPDPFRKITPPELYEGRSDCDLDLVDPELRETDRDRVGGWLEVMDAAVHADERVISATSTVQRASGTSIRVSSNGFEGRHEGTSIWYGAMVTLDEGDGRRPEAYRFVGGTHLEGLPDPNQVAAQALQRALDRLGSSKGKSGRCTMVVDAEAAPSLLGRVLGALSAGAIQQGRSFLADKLDAPIASSVLSLTDDPFLPRAFSSRHFDGEGIAAKRMPLVQDGVLQNFYIDTYYGRKLGWEPTTGSASNLVMTLGDRNLEGLLGEAVEGYFVTSWLGGNADLTTGDYSFGIRGHRIEGGAMGEPVSEMNITGNYLDLLSKLVAVGNDPVPWSTLRAPTLVFEDVQFSGA
jgi:PmbA protein